MRFALSILLSAFLAACQPQADPTPMTPLTMTPPPTVVPATVPPSRATASPERADPTVPPGATATVIETSTPLPTAERLPDRVPASPAPEVGEAPEDVVSAVREAARVQLGLPAEAVITVVRAEAVVWPDGALGCAEPGGFYTQAEAPGFWIEVEADGRRLDYRVPVDGFPIRCTHPGRLPLP